MGHFRAGDLHPRECPVLRHLPRPRYKDEPLIWILGGDRPVEFATAIGPSGTRWPPGTREGEEGRHLMTYHPMGGNTSAKWFTTPPGSTSTCSQSGHSRGTSDD